MRSFKVGLISLLVVASVIYGFIFFSNKAVKAPSATNLVYSSPSVTPEVLIDIKASFIIMTDAITRNFSNPKYHNKSTDVFITKNDPKTINVKKAGITWANFFETLPMKLTKECLITGDGERLCNKENGSLKFFLNEIEDEDLLDKEIKEGDKALIKFTSN